MLVPMTSHDYDLVLQLHHLVSPAAAPSKDCTFSFAASYIWNSSLRFPVCCHLTFLLQIPPQNPSCS